MKIIKNYLYFLLSKGDIRVFDLNLNYIGKFGVHVSFENWLTMNPINDSNYFYLFNDSELKVFNTNNFK